jgi:hypothetical protein
MAVARQLEQGLLDELLRLLAAERRPVPLEPAARRPVSGDLLARVRSEWPDSDPVPDSGPVAEPGRSEER